MATTKKIRCLIIGDEPPAQVILKKYISEVERLELVGICNSAVEAISVLQSEQVDLLFLDIQMPGLLGTKFIRTLNNPPKVIFTTAYRKFAVEGFELNAVDYLLKPIGFERFLQAVNKIFQINLSVLNQTGISTDPGEPENLFLYFRVDRRMAKVFLEDILFVESLKDYIKIVTVKKTIVTKQPISSLEALLPADSFIRIHRSYIIAVNKIDSFNADSVEIRKNELPVGRFYKQDVSRLLNNSSSPRHGNNTNK